MSSRFSHPNSFAGLESDSDCNSDCDTESNSAYDCDSDCDFDSTSISRAVEKTSLSTSPRQVLLIDPSPFAALELPPALSPAFKVSFNLQDLPVTVPLPFSVFPQPHRSLPGCSL